MLTYVIGDIHGCENELQALINECAMHAKTQPFKYIFIGDYVDRGYNVKGCIKAIRDLSKHVEVITLVGNHEAMLRGYVSSIHPNIFDGGRYAETYGDWHDHVETFKSYGINSRFDINVNSEFIDDYKWMLKLKLFHRDDHRFYVHAGVVPGLDLNDDQKLSAMNHHLIWIRETFLLDQSDFGKLVIHGHTPTMMDPRRFTAQHEKSLKTKLITYDQIKNEAHPLVFNNRVNVDTGCVFGGAMTAAVFNDKERDPIEFISIPSSFDYY